MKLIFATNNSNKVDEIRSVLDKKIKIITLSEAGINIDIPEPFLTLEENATAKAKTIFKMTSTDCFSEDTGLEVFALNGEPGVKSARYAGDNRQFDANIEKLLINLADKADRSAQFRTIISLIIDKEEVQFEGICKGKITETKRGTKGFGYDPVFVPDGSTKTFAEMESNEKNLFSHRRKATDKLVAFLNKQYIK